MHCVFHRLLTLTLTPSNIQPMASYPLSRGLEATRCLEGPEPSENECTVLKPWHSDADPMCQLFEGCRPP